jgi:hypothetical protein
LREGVLFGGLEVVLVEVEAHEEVLEVLLVRDAQLRGEHAQEEVVGRAEVPRQRLEALSKPV